MFAFFCATFGLFFGACIFLYLLSMAEVTAGDCHEDRISSKGENLTRQLAYTERGEDQRSEDIKNRAKWYESLCFFTFPWNNRLLLRAHY